MSSLTPSPGISLSIAIQAGGESRRMGQDKALMPFLGQPLIARVLERLRPIADEIFITTNHPQAYAFLEVPIFTDLIPGRGALGGLYTALSAASQPLVAVVACDMPFINPELLAAERHLLVEMQADAVVPRTGEGTEPFHAVYRRQACLPHLLAALEANRWRADAWFDQVKIHWFDPPQIIRHDPQLLSFRNVNTHQELQDAQAMAARLESNN